MLVGLKAREETFCFYIVSEKQVKVWRRMGSRGKGEILGFVVKTKKGGLLGRGNCWVGKSNRKTITYFWHQLSFIFCHDVFFFSSQSPLHYFCF